jgi:hypothetical protein
MTFLLKAARVVILLTGTLLAQGGLFPCDSTVQFVDHNQVDYTVKVRAMRGKVVDVDGVGVQRACLALFNSNHSMLLRAFEASENGEFTASGIKTGDYWLVVRDSQHAFCTASTRLKLRGGSDKSSLVVNMRVQGQDSCSWCAAKK